MNRLVNFVVLPLLAIGALGSVFLMSVSQHQSFTITPQCDVFASTYFKEYATDASKVLSVSRDDHTAYKATGADIRARILINGRIESFKEVMPKEEADELMDTYQACRQNSTTSL